MKERRECYFKARKRRHNLEANSSRKHWLCAKQSQTKSGYCRHIRPTIKQLHLIMGCWRAFPRYPMQQMLWRHWRGGCLHDCSTPQSRFRKCRRSPGYCIGIGTRQQTPHLADAWDNAISHSKTRKTSIFQCFKQSIDIKEVL